MVRSLEQRGAHVRQILPGRCSFDVDGPNVRAEFPADRILEPVEAGGLALGDDLDGPVGQVPHEAPDTEPAGQAPTLTELGCDMLQGYALLRPASASVLERLLQAQAMRSA